MRMILLNSFRSAPRGLRSLARSVSTLSKNPHIKVFNDSQAPSSHILTYLESSPPIRDLAIGFSTSETPTPSTFKENPKFVSILNSVLQEHGHQDEDVISQAQAYASQGGFNLGSGGAFFPSQQQHRRGASKRQGGGGGAGGGGAGGASAQGGAGGANRGGFVHLSDRRNPPDFGRIAWPEDILGSVEVDETGRVVGKVVPSGTYRVLTNEGILGLSPFLREKLVQRLREEEAKGGGV